MENKEIRYRNARALIAECGSITAFAEKLKKAETQVSGFAGINPRKGIGNKIARQIEVVFNKPAGWMDHEHTEEEKYMEELRELLQQISSEKQELAVGMVRQMVEVLRKAS